MTLGVALDDDDVVLTWTQLNLNTAYEVHDSSTPYFTPSDDTRLITLPAPTATHRAKDAAGNAGRNRFYILKARFVDSANALSAISTNEVAEFSFALTPGE